jgi:hypothetical protein
MLMETDPVIQALGEQVEWYRRLAKLAELQHVYVQNEQTEELLGVLGQRQEVLNEVARLEQVVGPVRKQWGGYVGGLPAERRGEAEGLMAETRRLLEEITTSDRNDAMVLQQRKLNLGKQITQAKAARQVNRNYATAAYGAVKSRVDFSR